MFLIVEKLNISAIYRSILLNFSVHLPLVFIYKFCEKENLPKKNEIQIQYYIILFDGSVFWVQVYNSPNYLEIKKDLGSKFHAPMIQNT